MASFWQYSANYQFFYNNKEKGGALPSNDAAQVLSDWNREFDAGETTHYLIDGVPLYKKRSVKFENIMELQDFFKTELFSGVLDSEKEFLSGQAILHFHQGGLPSASHYCVVNATLNKNPHVKATEPVSKNNFKPIKGGVSIIEDNIYSKLSVGNKRISSPDYHLKIHSELSFTTKGIHIQNLTIDCPNRQAAKILDRRTFWQLLQHIIDKLSQAIWPTNKDSNEQTEDAIMTFQPILESSVAEEEVIISSASEQDHTLQKDDEPIIESSDDENRGRPVSTLTF